MHRSLVYLAHSKRSFSDSISIEDKTQQALAECGADMARCERGARV